MIGSSQGTSTKWRGPYRSQTQIPRQTLHNRKKRKLNDTPSSACDEGSVAETPSETVSEATSLLDIPTVSSTLPTAVSDSVRDETFSDEEPMQKLFSGSSLSLSMSHALISGYSSRHHLSSQAQEDLLHLMQLHLPKENLLPSSLYMLQKVSESTDRSVEPISHFYCPRCYTVLPDCSSTTCPNRSCGTSLDPESTASFITIPIAEQLKNLLKRPGVYQSLQYSRSRPRKPGKLSDISDGQLYQKLASSGGPLADQHNISVVLNTDGVVVFRSTNYSFWPVLLMINELPFAKRKQPKNMLLAGLWYSNEKPPMQAFLKPIIEMLSKLESTGVPIQPPGTEELFMMKVCVIGCTCDLPAKAMVQNFIQFNGQYGCSYCEQPGRTIPTEKGGHVHTFPYVKQTPTGPPRTQQTCQQYALDAVQQHTVVTGVKGPSWLGCLNSFDFIKGMSPDYMHCALLGVSKLLLQLWTNPTYCIGTPHDIRADIPLLDERISMIAVPTEVRRKPRGISEMKHWKASEYRSWTLHYAIPVLQGVLNDIYLQHFILYSEALWLLLQSAPSLEDVAMAERLLQHFCFKFSAYYGERYQTANIHQLLHFADSVRNLGPLWAHSAFPFEDTNGWMGDLFHGSRNPQKQIVKSFLQRQQLSVAAGIITKKGNENSNALIFLDQLLSIGYRYSVTTDVGQGHLVLGKLSSNLTDAEVTAILEMFPSANLHNCVAYNRVLISGVIYTSSSYKRSSNTSDYVVCFSDGVQKSIGAAERFISFCDQGCTTCRASIFCKHVTIVNMYEIIQCEISTDSITGATAQHILQVGQPRVIKAQQTKYIHTKCVLLSINRAMYAALLPNFEEKDL